MEGDKNFIIRDISESDNKALAAVIRKVMEEFDVARPGTIYYDPVLDEMYEQYRDENSFYYVVECNGVIKGGCGINALAGAGKEYCELQRMFLSSDCRGKGIAQKLMDICLQRAAACGYTFCYLETIKEFKAAVRLYRKNGFEYVYGPIGNTGHFSCEIKMVKPLLQENSLPVDNRNSG